MDKPARDERRTLTAGAELAQMAFKAARDIRLRLWAGPELTALLDALGRYVDETSRQLEALEQAMESGSRPLPRKLREQLYGLLSVGAAEGQLGEPIDDKARPGGPRPGDITGPARREHLPCECEFAGPVCPDCPHHGRGA